MSIDHAVVAVPDLDEATQVFQKVGLVLARGGRHPAHGTHNALIGLGPACYLEIVAADPTACPKSQRGQRIASVARATLLEVLLRAPERIADHPSAAITGPFEGERIGDDGNVVRWQLHRVVTAAGERLPDLIRWRSEHPAAALAPQAQLTSVGLGVRDVAAASRALDALGALDGIDLIEGGQLRATIETPAGLSIAFEGV